MNQNLTKYHSKPMLLAAILLFSLTFLSASSHANEGSETGAIGPYSGAPASAVPWESLSTQQQETLAPIKDKWNDLPAERQQRLSNGANKWVNMNPEQREHVQERLNRFKNLSPEDKAQVKENMRKFRELPPEKRKALQIGRAHV